MLSSRVLGQQFGPTILEVIRQDDNERVICTKAVKTGGILELSRVVFRLEGIAAFPEVHRKVLDGISMGTAFAEASIPFRRIVHASRQYGQPNMPVVFTERFGTDGAATVTSLSIVVGPESLPYADILETYSPLVTPWELTDSDLSQEALGQLQAFGDELAARGDDA